MFCFMDAPKVAFDHFGALRKLRRALLPDLQAPLGEPEAPLGESEAPLSEPEAPLGEPEAPLDEPQTHLDGLHVLRNDMKGRGAFPKPLRLHPAVKRSDIK